MKRRTDVTSDVETVKAWLQKATETIPGFEGFEQGDRVLVTFHPKSLPDLSTAADLAIQDLTVKGELPIGQDPFSILDAIMETGVEIGLQGHLAVNIGFEESGCEQDMTSYDTLGVFTVKGKTGWSFWGNGLMKKSSEVGRDVLRRLVETAELPVRFSKRRDHGFDLEHSAGGWISVPQRSPEGTPVAFSCLLEEGAPPTKELLARMARVVREIGSGKLFTASWHAGPRAGDKDAPQVSRKVYGTVTARPEVFKAKRYEMQGEFRLFDLSGLETLRPLCRGKDRILTALGYTHNFEGDAINFEVETRARGHRLVVESRGGFDVYGLEEKLGVEFV